MGGGLGAMMWGADCGMGTTLIRGAGIIGGIGVMTCPGARRTTGATGGLGITGTADNRVVRTGGAICLTSTSVDYEIHMHKQVSFRINYHSEKKKSDSQKQVDVARQ